VPRYIPAVGLVLKQNDKGEVERVGTAWLAQGRGVLVTNAHVANEVDPASGGGWVVFPGTNGQAFQISGIELHPEYLRQLADAAASSASIVLTHDVALIRLATQPAVTGVPIASRLKLQALRELQPVAYVGYPMRAQAGGGTSIERPRPVAKSGTISSLTDWQQRETHSPADAHLIRHDLGVTGGASGSPLWDANGDVIGIICGMNVERVFNPTTRKFDVIPSAALVNFAQRIDVLTDWKVW
jgi:S1-C subfamily serine protease